MSKIDKIISQRGYAIRRVEYMDWLDRSVKNPVTFIEYIKDIDKFMNDSSLDGYIIAQVVINDLITGDYAVRVLYETEERPGALGGGREYGTVIYAMPTDDLVLLCKKGEQLKRALKFKTVLHNIFGRG